MTKPSRPPRKPYRTPRLTKFGDLRRLTQGDAKNKPEAGGGAKTKQSAGAAEDATGRSIRRSPVQHAAAASLATVAERGVPDGATTGGQRHRARQRT